MTGAVVHATNEDTSGDGKAANEFWAAMREQQKMVAQHAAKTGSLGAKPHLISSPESSFDFLGEVRAPRSPCDPAQLGLQIHELVHCHLSGVQMARTWTNLSSKEIKGAEGVVTYIGNGRAAQTRSAPNLSQPGADTKPTSSEPAAPAPAGAADKSKREPEHRSAPLAVSPQAEAHVMMPGTRTRASSGRSRLKTRPHARPALVPALICRLLYRRNER